MDLKFLHTVPRWDQIAWACWVVAFFVLETIGFLQKGHATTFTNVSKAVVPRWAIAMVIGWLWYHYLVQK